MRPVRRARGAGFTLVEAAVVVAVMGILLAVGMPSMSNLILGRKAAAAAAFYQEGLTLARNQAIARNINTRLVLTENAANGQMDWRVDLCKPVDGDPCDADNGAWSGTETPPAAAADPTFTSVQRSAVAMPGSDEITQGLAPSGATSIYFTPLGWVDARIPARLQRLTISPGPGRRGAFKTLTVAVTLSGVATVCDADAAAHVARGCPP
ncbi:GspH/FimT family pseudopilin [Massilia sp. YIM B02763]|uniref:pilus assembly FimT family protein n=1 Tax=Massilia sp. YIM B02763 TaxID=3050130 RepID=UPI0025B66BFD|nr:GspH/FimT family pseudopilin [Massilia sp. YIM B02763]